jgi:hypothetical protein
VRDEYFKELKKYQEDKKIARSNVVRNCFLAFAITLKSALHFRKAELSIKVAAGGGLGFLRAGANLISPLAWSLAGVLYIAECGINLRKYKRGEITKEEFKRRAFYGAIGKVSGIIGTSIGAAAGFMVGSMIMPGVGTITGTIVGGIAGGVTVSAITIKTIQRIDARITKTKDQ